MMPISTTCIKRRCMLLRSCQCWFAKSCWKLQIFVASTHETEGLLKRSV